MAPGPKSTKMVSLRLDEDVAERLDAAAMVRDTTVSELVREAIDDFVQKLSSDSDFKAEVSAHASRLKRLF